jgi:hypothetical protein
MAQVVKAHLTHATDPKRAFEATHEVGVIERALPRWGWPNTRSSSALYEDLL